MLVQDRFLLEGGGDHPGWRCRSEDRQAPDSLVQCRRSQLVRYCPLSIMASRVAALTAVEEEPHVPQSGWVRRPRGRKEGQRKCRLRRFEAGVVSFLCQCAVTAEHNLAFQTVLEDVVEVRLGSGSSRGYWSVRSLTAENQECWRLCWRT